MHSHRENNGCGCFDGAVESGQEFKPEQTPLVGHAGEGTESQV